jgi:trehalose-6-phosphatase
LVSGKCVLNVTDRHAPHKGAAVETLRRRLRCELAAFVGDDVTDEDAFALADVGSLIAIRVGRTRRSGAPWFITDQMEVDSLLEVFVRSREAKTPMRYRADDSQQA